MDAEMKINYHTGYTIFMIRMGALPHPYDRDFEMERIHYLCNRVIMTNPEPSASIARGALAALDFYEKIKGLPL